MKLFENKRNCCGCAACMNVCPAGAVKMAADEEGFEYPFIDTEKCVECGLCKKVCPVEEIRTNSKPKIGIINMQHTDNYGAVIAAAALENAVRETAGDGYEVCTVNYIPKKHFKSRFETRKDLVKLSGGLKLYVKTLFRRHSEPTDLQKRAARFAAYRKKYLHTTQVCHNPEHLAQTDRYAAFITGSDIVWAKKHADCYRAEGYYLKFAKNGERKIAFAPSLDNSVDRKLLKLSGVYRKNLEGFDFISVRETCNLDFIRSLTDKKVYHCCDPAFLPPAEYYDSIISSADVNNDGEKYIYVYILEVNDEIVEYANKLAKEKNLKICYFSANHSNYEAKSENCYTDGPAEFLYRLKNAEYVLTNSFHCVVFSVLFRKKFLSFFRSKISIKAADLLSLLGLENRIAANNKNIDEFIDYEAVGNKIQSLKLQAEEFLKKSLSFTAD